MATDGRLVPSPGVTLVASSHVGRSWSVFTHDSLEDGRGCAVFLGEDVPKPLLMGEGEVGSGEIFCTR